MDKFTERKQETIAIINAARARRPGEFVSFYYTGQDEVATPRWNGPQTWAVDAVREGWAVVDRNGAEHVVRGIDRQRGRDVRGFVISDDGAWMSVRETVGAVIAPNDDTYYAHNARVLIAEQDKEYGTDATTTARVTVATLWRTAHELLAVMIERATNPIAQLVPVEAGDVRQAVEHINAAVEAVERLDDVANAGREMFGPAERADIETGARAMRDARPPWVADREEIESTFEPESGDHMLVIGQAAERDSDALREINEVIAGVITGAIFALGSPREWSQ